MFVALLCVGLFGKEFSMRHPLCLNFGSGKDFKPAAVNVDMDSLWKPDIVFDLSQTICGRTFSDREVWTCGNLFEHV